MIITTTKILTSVHVDIFSVFYGTIRSADVAWAMDDIGVGLMAWLNIIDILILFFMGRQALKAVR